MFRESQYPRLRMFQGQGNRSKDYKESSPAIHPSSIVAHYPNKEMLEASQLSMDSELRANSQPSIHSANSQSQSHSSNFVYVPLGQPSASMSSSVSSSADEQLQHQRRCHIPNQVNHSMSIYSGGERERTHAHTRSLRQMSESSFPGSSIKSSLRATKKGKTFKTRFAGVGDTRGLISRHTNGTSQGSYSASLSQSSHESLRTSQSGGPFRVRGPATQTMRTINGHLSSRSGSSSSSYNQQCQLIEQEFNTFHRGSEVRSVCDLNSDKKQKRSSTTGLRNPIFSKIATPRKKVNIPYPPIKSQPQQQHPLSTIQHTESKKFRRCGFEDKNEMSKSRNLTERACCNKEKTCRQRNDELKIDRDARTSIHVVTKRSGDPRQFNKDQQQKASQDSLSVSGLGSENSSSKLLTVGSRMGTCNTEYFSPNPIEEVRQERQSTASEPENLHAGDRYIKDFKNDLQKLMNDMESQAKANFEKVSQTIISATESKLDENTKSFHEAIKVKFGEEANALQVAAQSNLDLLVRKQSQAETAIETLQKSTTTKLEETASASVEKLEGYTESGLTKLKAFTETWLSNSCNSIANRLKPYLRLSSEITDTTSIGNDNIVGDQATTSTDVNENIKSLSVVDHTKKSRLKGKPVAPLDHSLKEDQTKIKLSSIEGEISLTQGSGSTYRRNSIDTTVVPARPLRRSKIMKLVDNKKRDTNMDGKESLASRGHSPKKDQTEIISSSIEGEISITQGSESTYRMNGVDTTMVPARPLRRSKRMKQEREHKGGVRIDEIKHTKFVKTTNPTQDKKKSRNLPTRSSDGKKEEAVPKHNEGGLPLTVAKCDNALCVTPTEGNSRSSKERKKSNLSIKKSKNETNRLNPKRPRRKKLKTPSPLMKKQKRPKIQCDSSIQRSIPSEVVAFDNFLLSPLEDPNLFAFPMTKQRPNVTMYGSRSALKPIESLGRKKRKNPTRTYERRKKIFDVMDDDVFRF